jgi:hypothetical protein
MGTTQRRRAGSVGSTIAGVLAGGDQQVFRSIPPAQELVHHARPDDPVACDDGTLLVIRLLDLAEADPVDAGGPESAATTVATPVPRPARQRCRWRSERDRSRP